MTLIAQPELEVLLDDRRGVIQLRLAGEMLPWLIDVAETATVTVRRWAVERW